MADISVTLVLPNGSARRADVPDDVAVRDLLAELTSLLGLPTVGPDGRPMGYRMDSKALGRELREDETLAASGIPSEDRLMITTDITAGAGAISPAEAVIAVVMSAPSPKASAVIVPCLREFILFDITHILRPWVSSQGPTCAKDARER